MSTVVMNAKIIKLDEIELSSNLQAIEEGDVLEFTEANGSQDRALYIQHMEYGEERYERKSDWMRLINKLNRYDDKQLRSEILGDFNGEMYVSNIDFNYSNDGILIEFTEPARLLLETIGDKAVVIEVSKLKGELTWEWAYTRGGADDLDGLANHLEIYIHNIQIVE